jgi:beta-fructofuranosidase
MNPDNIAFAALTEALEGAHVAREALLRDRTDSYYPAFHLAAPAGWINDPNGLCHFKGKTHVYYQHNPYETVWGPMHWGHLSSDDLLTWRHEPMALAPSIEADHNGCWSGSAVTGDDGLLYVFYTGYRNLRHIDEDPRTHHEVQCLATSVDGTTFEKRGVVVGNPEKLANFRDPKVFRHKGTWYMVLGQESRDHRGQIRLFESTDLLTWTDDGVIYECGEPGVFMLECPDLFEIRGRWVLAFSAMGFTPDGYKWRARDVAGYVVGTWQPGSSFKALTEFTPLDYGHNYYAPQSFAAEDGRRLQFGWMRPPFDLAPEQCHQWCGQLTVCRELSLTDDKCLRQVPIPEVDALFESVDHRGNVTLDPNEEVTLADDVSCCRVSVTFDLTATTAERVGLYIGCSRRARPLFVGYDDLAGWVVCDRAGAIRGARGHRGTPVSGDTLSLDLYVDRSCVEVFVNGGLATLTELYYPAEDEPRSLVLASECGVAHITELEISRLRRSIW